MKSSFLSFLSLVSLSISLSFAAPAMASKHSPRGPAEASVTIMMFGDFECPFTQRSHQMLKELMVKMPQDVKIVFRHFPLDFHPNARAASHAAVCAGEQNKFWEMHDGLFAVPHGGLNPERMTKIASEIGLNMDHYKSCMQSDRPEKEVANDIAEGSLLRVNGTPNFVLSGYKGLKKVNGAYPLEDMLTYIQEVK